MKFKAELKKIEQYKLASIDNQYKITLITDNSAVLDLGKEIADTIFDVIINKENDRR